MLRIADASFNVHTDDGHHDKFEVRLMQGESIEEPKFQLQVNQLTFNEDKCIDIRTLVIEDRDAAKKLDALISHVTITHWPI